MRSSVSIITPSVTGESAQAYDLCPGQSVTFGPCNCGRCLLDVKVANTRVGGVTGRLIACEDHWRIANFGPTARLVVEDLEHAYHLITVAAQTSAVVPFELADVSVGGFHLLRVFGPEAQGPSAQAPVARPSCAQAADPLHVDTAYFAVLVALCEPRLRGFAGTPLPTSAEIAEALRHKGLTLSSRAVDAHIEYLLDKLALALPRDKAQSRHVWRKEILVTTAIRRGLVGPEHLPDTRSRDDPGRRSWRRGLIGGVASRAPDARRAATPAARSARPHAAPRGRRPAPH
jgi:serine/threonine-protein kinase